MSKTPLTKDIEKSVLKYMYKMSCFSCNEVGIVVKVKKPSKYNPNYLVDKYETEIVDVMTYDQNRDIFKTVEIKISKSDFNSKAKLSFVGNYNYLAMPKELYEQVKNDIPKGVGVLINNGGWYCQCVVKPKKQELKYPKEKLLISMTKSLSREFYKKIFSKE
jgi:hypothetical protein